jgi:catechol 2,3-dioxygenase-like lactoylglutathione lyase family enzyme
MDYRIELLMLPVADADRAKDFYLNKAGFALETDNSPAPGIRVIQATPPGSSCSIVFGDGMLDASEPGRVIGTHLVVTDIVAARDELVARGVEVSEIRHMTPQGWADGPDPDRADYNSFADFADPDGNTWVLQERKELKPR